MKVFPERDGNLCLRIFPRPLWLLVRMKVFPERDGNSGRSSSQRAYPMISPNEGLPWKGWKQPSHQNSRQWLVRPCPNEGLPWKGWKLLLSRRFNTSWMIWSEWRSSLKGMETREPRHWWRREMPLVRMKVFPERDGNLSCSQWIYELNLALSEWRSSLKGMETSNGTLTIGIWYRKGPNEGLPWKGWKL